MTRPTPLPGKPQRPTLPDRPTTRPTPLPTPQPPSFGRPTRPGININNLNNTIINTRPIIGGSNSNIINIINNNTNITINQNINNFYGGYVHRPSWDFGPTFALPTWGIGGSYWYDHWHYNCIYPSYRWYNGCWHGYWNSSWYAPVTYVAIGWGLNSWTRQWSTFRAYYNPYYVILPAQQSVPYDYSRPVVVNNYMVIDDQGNPTYRPPTTAEDRARAMFDEGLNLFKQGEYVQAITRFNQSLRDLPGDAVVHEVRCLALFAIGDYQGAAAGLNSLLSSAPGMDWTTVSGLYGNQRDYSRQLRKLENFVKKNPNDAAANFVLAYHYLVLGEKEQAVAALKAVVQAQPRDVVAQRMLDALEPKNVEISARELFGVEQLQVSPDAETDLVGRWTATKGESTVNLEVNEDFTFTWLVSEGGKPTSKLSGNLAGAADGLELITADQGTLAGTVISQGADSWVFKIAGSPPADPGLKFARVR